MRLSLAAGSIWLSVLGLTLSPAQGMQFQPIPVTATELVLDGRGPIVAGDYDRLMAALDAVPQNGRTLLALSLDSPGGAVAEAKQMVTVIRSRHLPVVVPHNSQCASACFLLFAASPRRLAATDALIGVHSANQSGAETETALAVTTLMARDAAALGVPPSVIGKMVQTTPGRVEWLDPQDLASMQAAVFDGDPVAALHQSTSASKEQEAPASALPSSIQPIPQPDTQVNPASGYTAGRDDRRIWDAWMGGLRGDYQRGASFAQSQMYTTEAGSCYGPNNVNRGDYTLGCNVARQKLATVVVKLRADSSYAMGWNTPVPPVNASEPVEEEFHGVYFCTRQVAHLVLKIFQQVDGGRRRGLFIFGPNDNNRDVPGGSFLVEGIIDLNGGKLILTPVKWLSQPAGYSWFGLNGGSDDGGKTFSGQLTDSSNCTRFTLARAAHSTVAR